MTRTSHPDRRNGDHRVDARREDDDVSGRSGGDDDRPSIERRRGDVRAARRPSLWTRMWRPFWAVPVAAVLFAAIAGIVAPHVERLILERVGDVAWWLFGGSADSASDILSTIASAMISVTGLVFSITLVVLQLASSQFTPRLVGVFLASRIVQGTLAVFMSSFVYALTVLRSVRTEDAATDVFVPRVSVTLALLLVLASMGAFLAFIHHVTSSIHVGTMISRVGDRTMRVVGDTYAETDVQGGGPTWSPAPGTPRRAISVGDRHGRVTHVDHVGLAELAAESDVVVVLDVLIGDFVPDGAVIGHVWGPLPRGGDADAEGDGHEGHLEDGAGSEGSPYIADTENTGPHEDAARTDDDPFGRDGHGGRRDDGSDDGSDDTAAEVGEKVARAVSLGTESDLDDVGFGLRQLMDIAERALSPGINDPTTAIQAINEMHRVLRLLVQRLTPSAFITHDGVVRVVHRPRTVEDFLQFVIPEVAFHGAQTARIPSALESVLTDLREVALPRYHAVIDRLLEALPPDPLKEGTP